MMKKKLFVFTLIFSVIIALTSLVFATDIVMDLNNSSSASQASNSTTATNTTNTTTANPSNTVAPTDNSVADNTIYSSSTADTTAPTSDEPSVTTTSSYEDSGELSISNMINIVLIVVGIVLILLGVAIIIKLKK